MLEFSAKRTSGLDSLITPVLAALAPEPSLNLVVDTPEPTVRTHTNRPLEIRALESTGVPFRKYYRTAPVPALVKSITEMAL